MFQAPQGHGQGILGQARLQRDCGGRHCEAAWAAVSLPHRGDGGSPAGRPVVAGGSVEAEAILLVRVLHVRYQAKTEEWILRLLVQRRCSRLRRACRHCHCGPPGSPEQRAMALPAGQFLLESTNGGRLRRRRVHTETAFTSSTQGCKTTAIQVIILILIECCSVKTPGESICRWLFWRAPAGMSAFGESLPLA